MEGKQSQERLCGAESAKDSNGGGWGAGDSAAEASASWEDGGEEAGTAEF